MAAGALIFNKKNKMLVVKPTYKSYWSIPGGVIEMNESPLQACQRELKEELSLDIKLKSLLIIDYKNSTREFTESIQFLFDGGKLTDKQIEDIKLPAAELAEFTFIKISEIKNYLSSRMVKRIEYGQKALLNTKTYYLEEENSVF